MMNAILREKLHAGNPHAWFDEGKSASYSPSAARPKWGATPGHGVLLYSARCLLLIFAFAVVSEVRAEEAVPVISGNNLVFTVEQGESKTYSSSITGSAGVVKEGPGTLTLTGANDFVGTVTVNGGVLKANPVTSLGKGNRSKVTVVKGAQLDISGGDASGNDVVLSKDFEIEGDGPDGTGAIVRNSGVGNDYFIGGVVTLTGDATVRSTSKMGWGCISCKGYRLTVRGGAEWFGNYYSFSGGTGGGIYLCDGSTLTFQIVSLEGDADNYLRIAEGGTMAFFAAASNKTYPWALQFEKTGTVKAAYNVGDPTSDVWSGPVEIAGGEVTIANSSYLTFAGPVTNTAAGNGLKFEKRQSSDSVRGTTYFKGGIDLQAPSTYAGGFNLLTATAYLQNGKTYSLGYTQLWNGLLEAQGEGTVLNFRKRTYCRGDKGHPGRLVISGGASIGGTDDVYLPIGADMDAIFRMSGGGSAKIYDLFVASDNVRQQGAVYQADGDLTVSSLLRMGRDAGSSGFFLKRSGNLSVNGAYVTETYTLGSAGDAVFYNDSGDVAFVKNAAVMSKAGGNAVLWMRGGTLTGTLRVFESTSASGHALVALEGLGTASTELLNKSFCGTGDAVEILAVNDGARVSGSRFVRNDGANGKLYVSSSGGVFKPTYQQSWDNGVESQGPDEWLVHEGGIVIDTDVIGGKIKRPFLAPTGKVVTAVTLPEEAIADVYIGAPAVTITGVGHAAAAVAIFDENTGKLTGVKVIAPGSGYDENTTATIPSADGKSFHTCAVTIADPPMTGKGLIKRGSGEWYLENDNTYYGPTTVEGGTLDVSVTTAIPRDGAGGIVMRGGTFNIRNYQPTIPTLVVEGAANLNVSGITVTDTLTLTNSPTAKLTVNGKLTLDDGAKLELVGSVSEIGEQKCVLLEATGGIECKGTFTIPELADNYHARVTGNKITVGPQRGMVMIFR